jgi:cell division protein FtsI/penicillin-binding protein 2
MQELKHLSRHKRAIEVGYPMHGTGNRVNRRSGERRFPRLSMPTGKRREQLKHLLLFFAVVLALTPCSVYLFKKTPKALSGAATLVRSAAEAAKSPPANSFETAYSLLDGAAGSPVDVTARTADGQVLHYSVNGALQKRVHDFMVVNQVPYGAFVAIEPSTGRILSMTSHSSADPAWAQKSFFELYPMASLFKIITASAALEAKKITPDTVIEFRGNAYSENPRRWSALPKGKNNRMDVTYAMGKSINPVYGRVACDIAGKTSVMECVDRFGFNQPLLPGTPTKASRAAEPQSSMELMLMGAGLDHEVKISPLHAAVMMAAIANGGRMMAPGLVDRITDGSAQRDAFAPREIRRLVSPETAVSLKRMLSSTVTSGTSRKAFHDRRGRPRVPVDIAAKTGSINGTDPRGHYSWFAAFAPANNPKIALVALVINQDKWKIKSSQVGEQALEEFFSH